MSNLCEVFQNLADLATCASGDFHFLHFNVAGEEFDTMHGKVLKRYYEQAADDADELGEWASAFNAKNEYATKNPNEAAKRINYTSVEREFGKLTRQTVVNECTQVLHALCEKYLEVFKAIEKRDCPMCVGAANLLQSRLEYWAKELSYFNKQRFLRTEQVASNGG